MTGKPMSAAAFLTLAEIRYDAIRTGYRGHTELRHRLTGRRLVAHCADLIGVRTHEHDVRTLTDLTELGVLRQEAVPRMDGLGARHLRGRYDLGDVQVAVPRRRWTDANVLVGEADVERLAVRF